MNTFEKWFYALLAVAMIGLLSLIHSCKPKSGEIPITKLVIFGTVSDVSRCSRKKYGLDCRVTVVKAGQSRSYYFDVTDYPGEHVQKGDVIGLQTRTYKKSRESLLYRNGWVSGVSTSYCWSSCEKVLEP